MGEKKANEHKPVGSEETAHRGGRLGKRSPGQVVATKLRVIGNEDAKTPPLEVAAFNSFIG